jgi:hypothetical protein
MSRRLFRLAAVTALLPVVCASLVARAASPMSAEQGWSSVARCAQEDSERARHACLDRVLRDAGLLTTEMDTRQQRRAFGLEEQRAAAAKAPAPAPAPPVAAEPEPAADRLEVAIASVRKGVDGMLLVTTAEGAVWRQSESVEMPLPPVAGDRMKIRKGAMSGYRCSVARTNLTFRCARNL